MSARYNWNRAPAWATHAATDADGSAYWYARKPTMDVGGWVTRWQAEQMPTRVDDWAESMEQRPKDTTQTDSENRHGE